MKTKILLIIMLLFIFIGCDFSDPNFKENQEKMKKSYETVWDVLRDYKCTSENLDIVEKDTKLCNKYSIATSTECYKSSVQKYCSKKLNKI
jgi:hypothetical protein